MTASPKINLVYNKYVSADNTKNISEKEFYTNLQTQTQTQTQPLCVYLTNGTNKQLNNIGSGTTDAFRQLSDKAGVGDLFDVSKAVIVFDSSLNEFDNKTDILSIISDTKQVWTHSKYNGMFAGSVIRVDASGNGNNTDFPVCGGYHINGINLKNITNAIEKKKVETNSVGLVKAYYTAIMDDFFKIAIAAPSGASTPVKHHVLHLAQIPGTLYGGTEITGNAFHTAVKDWIAGKANVTPPLSMSMTISIDFEKPVSGPTPPPVPPKTPTPQPVGPSSSSLKTRIDAVTATTKKFRHPLFKIANEIYNAFFGTTPKTGTKESLTEHLTKKLTEIENAIPVANKAEFQGIINKVKNDLQNAATSTTTTTTTTPSVKPVMTPTKKYVFAFDIDNTLVQHGILEPSSLSSFNTNTHAAEYDKMVARMKEIIKAGYYVWIVTANTNITKDNFEKNYLQSNTDNSITSSDKYYFMNPGVVTTELSGQFNAEKFKSFTTSPPLTHDLNFTNSGNEFQNKGLKPYAMRAKWMQLGHAIDDANVEMYLFDDSQTYEANCKSLKVNFVKIEPSTVSGGTPNFSSDVLQQATEVFEKIETSSGPGPTSGGGNLNVMTFNTWHEALGDSPNQTFCMDGTTNKCQKNIRQAILDHMNTHEQSIVFLQEFTYKFDEFFKVNEVKVNTDGFASKIKAKDSSSIPAFRYFTMTYNSKKFHVYIGQIGFSVIATIYSNTFHAGPADAFFVGNLAAGNLKAGSDASKVDSYDLAYTFSGTSDKSSVTETPSPKSGYAFGGNRPFIVLRFDATKCVLVNVHVPHGGNDDVFRDGSTGKPTGKPTGTLAEFAFNALARFIPDTVFKDTSKNQNEYAFILGGDFNTATPDIKKWLKEPTTPAVNRTTGTCCTTDGGLNFTTTGAVDHIFSTLPITKYSVHDINTTEKTTTNPRYFFSDHLPVYAEIDFKAPAAATSSP